MRFTILLSGLLVVSAFAGCFGDKPPEKPVAKFSYEALEEPDSFRFDASASKAASATYVWTFGDNENATGKEVEHTYEYTNGVYAVTLCVVDGDDDQTCVTQDVTVGTGLNQLPEAHFTRTLAWAGVGESITFDASASLDRDSDPLTYKWDFNYPIENADYNAFREAANGGEGDGDTGNSNGDGEEIPTGPSSTDAPKPGVPQAPIPTRPSSGDHGPTGPQRNFLYGATETTAATFTTHSYPEPGLYIIRLQAVDIKGGIGEDYWPIQIDESPPKRSFTLDPPKTGVTRAGSAGYSEQTPSIGDAGDPDENTTTITLPHPATAFLANLSWDEGQPIGSSSQNQLVLRMNDSGGETYGPAEDGSGVNLDGKAQLDLLAQIPAGAVEFTITGISGVNIAWTLDVYAKLDTNPFPDGLIVETGGHHQ